MPTSMPAYLTPAVLRWARESIGYELSEAAALAKIRPQKLASAEEGLLLLSLPEAERAAKVYDRPLVDLLSPEIPDEPAPEVRFRRLPDAPDLPWPPALVKLFRHMTGLQEEAVELYEELGETPPWPAAAERLAAAPWATLVGTAGAMLGVAPTARRDAYGTLRAWTSAVEALGVLVMQRGDVPKEVIRAFALPHDVVPVIVVNTGDVARARAFSVVHELGHLVLSLRRERVHDAEAWCNDFAGEVVMPAAEVRTENARLEPALVPIDRAARIASTFGVTPTAAAIRLRRLAFFSEADVDDVQNFHRRLPEPKSGGGDWYANTVAQRGRAFLRLAFSALDHGVITYPHACRLLGTKTNNFGLLRDQLEGRRQRRSGAEPG